MDIVKMLRDREDLVKSGYFDGDDGLVPMDLLDMNELAYNLSVDTELTYVELFNQALYVMLREIREGRLTYDDAEENKNSEWYSLQKWYWLLGWPYEIRSMALDNSIYAAQNTILWFSKIGMSNYGKER